MCIQDVFKPVHREYGQPREFEGKRGGVCLCMPGMCVCLWGEGWVVLLCLSGGVCVCLGVGELFAGLVTLCWGGPGREGEKGGCMGNNALH